MHAARLNEKTVDVKNFEYAVERVIAGNKYIAIRNHECNLNSLHYVGMEKRSNTMSPEERRTLAFHEAGHAVVGWMLEHTDPLLKVDINLVLAYLTLTFLPVYCCGAELLLGNDLPLTRPGTHFPVNLTLRSMLVK